jgi:hypothetical protein
MYWVITIVNNTVDLVNTISSTVYMKFAKSEHIKCSQHTCTKGKLCEVTDVLIGWSFYNIYFV